MQIPLHNNLPQYVISQSPKEYKKTLGDRAKLAYTMFSFAAAATAKRSLRLPPGVVAGFSTQFVSGRLIDAGMMKKPVPKVSPRVAQNEAHREAVRNDPTRGLSNWELCKYNAAVRATYKTGQAKPNPADFRGLPRA